ncbi:hypothetical protein [Sphingobium lactosutens]|jgi:hypothetical protein|uniref:hypothetical protein n=1 Tax=Sphingobium lactosutens TaxID=522773 RepID=UPI000C4142BC|nr:hypothetical protein [Sphingobium lactosutens]MBS47388.1 hypothetical protein [Sphingobium sp.]MCC4258578.1 hypothetical protein [Sphingobium lactosutens]|tara:strand:- start:964 stop:1746 length:783 start_codon:yes stop_codon:yes gene_type:complete
MIENPFFLASAPLSFETTSFEIPASPGANLANDNMDMAWRSIGLDGIYVVMRCSAPVDTVAILHSNLRASDTVRIRAATTVDGTLSAPVYDSGPVPAFEGQKLAPYTTKTMVDLGQTLQSLFWRFDFTSPGNPAGQIEAARIIMGERIEVPSGIDFNWEKGQVDDSILTSGPNYEDVQEYAARPTVKATLGAMDEATFNRFDAFMMTVGRSKAVLFAPEPDNLETAQHWTVYGRVKVDWKGQNPYHNWWDTDMQIAGLRA